MPLSLMSINIERSRHLEKVSAFIKARNPDVVCLQEVMERDLPYLEEAVGGKAVFAQSWRYLGEGVLNVEGVAVISKLPIDASSQEQYGGMLGELPEFEPRDKIESIKKLKRILTTVDVSKGGAAYRIMTTHFTWTPDGGPDEVQRKDAKALLVLLEDKGEFTIIGDFNTPRMFDGSRGEIFSMFSSKYKDNIPPEYETSIDLDVHYAAKTAGDQLKERMVDVLFTTPGVVASDVALHKGVSDHMAVSATISRAL